jgi:prophage regulatory protein
MEIKMNHERLIRLDEVCSKTGLSRSMVYLLIKKDQFPKQIVLAKRMVAWRESAIDEWIAGKISNENIDVIEESDEAH